MGEICQSGGFWLPVGKYFLGVQCILGAMGAAMVSNIGACGGDHVDDDGDDDDDDDDGDDDDDDHDGDDDGDDEDGGESR